jgi:integrase
MLTGLRPGELVHLLLPDDLDFEERLLHIRNRINLGWQVKTRNERTIPLLPCLDKVLERLVEGRTRGPVFLRKKFNVERLPPWASNKLAELELSRRILSRESESGESVTRTNRVQLSRSLWNEMGIVETDRIRTEYIRLTKAIGQPELTAPKTLRHLFATTLQDANVDPLIRNELLGHAAASAIGGNSLGMTTKYTHTRMETKRKRMARNP